MTSGRYHLMENAATLSSASFLPGRTTAEVVDEIAARHSPLYSTLTTLFLGAYSDVPYDAFQNTVLAIYDLSLMMKGWDVESYLDLLARGRSATHELLETWDDASLDKTIGDARHTISHRWVLYHILEHYAAHFGQILSLMHCMRDQRVPGLPEKRGGF